MTTITKSWESVEDIAIANKNIGHHWFDKDSMRFFASRVCWGEVYAGCFFISSEQDKPRQPFRRYTIRKANDRGEIDTHGDFQQYTSLAMAKRAARKLAPEDY